MASHIGRRKFLATLGGAAAWPLAARGDFITLLGGAAAVWPFVARAQQRERTRRIGTFGLAVGATCAFFT